MRDRTDLFPNLRVSEDGRVAPKSLNAGGGYFLTNEQWEEIRDHLDAVEDELDALRTALGKAMVKIEIEEEETEKNPEEDRYYQRVNNFRMTARDWELFSTKEGVEDVACALNYSLRSLLMTDLPSTVIRDAMYRIMNDYESFGARDTEPETNLCYFINAHRLDDPVSRWS